VSTFYIGRSGFRIKPANRDYNLDSPVWTHGRCGTAERPWRVTPAYHLRPWASIRQP